MDFEFRELPIKSGNIHKVTYIVTFDNVVYFARELTRHVFLQQHSGYEFNDIVWGGVLKANGEWERKSFDFGDAPSISERESLVQALATLIK